MPTCSLFKIIDHGRHPSSSKRRTTSRFQAVGRMRMLFARTGCQKRLVTCVLPPSVLPTNICEINYTAAAVCKMYKDLTGRYNIVTIGQTASMSMLTFFESRYTCTPIDLINCLNVVFMWQVITNLYFPFN